MPYGIKGVFVALPLGVIFALEGFEQAAQLAGEARNPKRDIPLAVVGSMLMGAALYMALQICFIGALNPHNVAHGWANPFGNAGAFGPYYTLATSVGLGWLGVVLIIDALISPGGTGLVYLATTSRLSYSLARVRFLPPVFSGIDRRGVPWFSIVVRRRVRLPAVPAVRRLGQAGRRDHRGVVLHVQLRAGRGGLAAQERPRPPAALQGPRAEHHRPVQLRGVRPDHLLERDLERGQAGPGRACSSWSCTSIARRVDPAQAPIDFKAGAFSLPWIIGLTIFSIFGGSYVGGYPQRLRHRDPPPPAVLVGHRRGRRCSAWPSTTTRSTAASARSGWRQRARGHRRRPRRRTSTWAFAEAHLES